MRILIAEDEVTSRRILEKMLERHGHEVVSTRDGLEALSALAQDDSPRLAILDWMMPEVDGVEICKRVRARKSGPHMYLILLTARSQKEDIVEGLDSGADDYLVKPFAANELIARVRVGERVLGLQQELQDRVHELEEALEHVRTLQGLLPICMHCHRIRDTEEHWQALETYLSVHTDAQLSHSLCPECYVKHYGEYLSEEERARFARGEPLDGEGDGSRSPSGGSGGEGTLEPAEGQ